MSMMLNKTKNEQLTILAISAVVLGVVYLGSKKMKSTITSGAELQARELIKTFEGFSSKVYLDTAKLPTIGYGHLLKKGESFPNGVTQSQADKLLDDDMKTAVNAVNRLVKANINTNQKAALISLVFNIGEGNFKSSTLLKRLNAGESVAAEFDKWVYSGGQVTKGLVSRRTKEKQVFLS